MKYELLFHDFKTIMDTQLYRVRYLKDFSWIREGRLGGYIASENCLSQEGDCFVDDRAYVFPDSKVEGNAKVYGKAWIQGKSIIRENASVFDNASVFNGIIEGNAKIFGQYLVSNETIDHNQTRVRYG